MNKKILIAGLLVSVMLLVPINSAYSNIGIQIKQSTRTLLHRGNTLYVGGDGLDNYTKIQDAIDNASDGDTVFVYDDSSPYNEWGIEVNKSINFIGEDKNSTIIDGSNSGYTIKLTADGVNISGFTIQKGFDDGINISSNFNTIKDNIILGNMEKGITIHKGFDSGICLFYSSGNNILDNSILKNSWDGILLWYSTNNTIIGNSILQNSCGIDFIYSSGNNISHNDISNKYDGLYLYHSMNNNIDSNEINYNFEGIVADCISNNNSIIGNNILKNYWGICSSSSNIIKGNNISFNNGGIDLYKSNKSVIKSNNIASNSNLGILIRNSSSIILYSNNFVNNSRQAFDENYNNWDNGYPSGGNYWDDYAGEDNDGDGIGDTPYPIPGGDNEDRYPLMYPTVNFPPTAPIITGPKIGKPKVEHEYTFNSTDPNNDSVRYFIDWGDNTSELTGYCDSGEEITLKHNFNNKGNFTIKVKAVDPFGAESDWSEFTVTMPRDKSISNSLCLRFLERFPLLQTLLMRLGLQ